MRPVHLYEVKMIDGSKYQGEIAYKDERMVVLKMQNSNEQSANIASKVRLFYNGIISIQELGWQRGF
ncbi:MAG: hypothetical protein ABIL22_01800 [candidate division WOR-3 bacterium]